MCVHTCMYTYTEGDLALPDPPPPVSPPHSHFLLALHLLFLQHLPGDRTETAAINYCVLLPLHVFLKAKVWKTEVDLYKAGTSTFLTPGGLLLDERGGKLEDMEHNSAAVQADGNKVLKLEHLFGFPPSTIIQADHTTCMFVLQAIDGALKISSWCRGRESENKAQPISGGGEAGGIPTRPCSQGPPAPYPGLSKRFFADGWGCFGAAEHPGGRGIPVPAHILRPSSSPAQHALGVRVLLSPPPKRCRASLLPAARRNCTSLKHHTVSCRWQLPSPNLSHNIAEPLKSTIK